MIYALKVEGCSWDVTPMSTEIEWQKVSNMKGISQIIIVLIDFGTLLEIAKILAQKLLKKKILMKFHFISLSNYQSVGPYVSQSWQKDLGPRECCWGFFMFITI